ncbi:aldo/keto reductase [bacterium]|nr:aldo/keto reductase [bacterium]
MKINRRDFLASLTAAAGAVAFGGPVSSRKTEAPAKSDPFRLVPLGNTGIKVTLIGAGTGMSGAMRQSNMTRMGMERYTAVLRHAFDRGIRFYDCADLYGTHPFVAEAFKSIPREQITLSSKIWFSAGGLPEPERPDADIVVDRFRKELKMDYIDLVLIHCMTDSDWTGKMKRQMDILSDLKAKGIIRAHGVSIHSLEALKACVDSPWVDSVHARINAFGAAMDDRNPDRVAPVIEAIHKAGKGVVAMKLIGGGHFRDKPDRIDRSIQYVLGLGTADTMIVGFESEREIDDFAERVHKALDKTATHF